ncbi:hypothetical protein [Sulfuricella sp.]|uniref:hypothetical protein n=1 Tax=Sulfuricella sp. TaxID=2099377 RepID=UPI002B92DB76|nr:hypothetical protein [Sulfuricella sp.]HUX62227.1 hypothetical protein [Sulfuricella sp.]
MTDIYLGHPRELIEMAVVLPSGHFVQLDDFLFDLHGLGPRFARVQTQDYRGHRALSYAYLDMPGTTYDLISELDNPRDLGAYEDLATDEALAEHLTAIFIEQSDYFPTHQQLALALICARAKGMQASDELGMHRLAKWALAYEKRAHWISKNRQLAYSLPSINWEAMKL